MKELEDGKLKTNYVKSKIEKRKSHVTYRNLKNYLKFMTMNLK